MLIHITFLFVSFEILLALIFKVIENSGAQLLFSRAQWKWGRSPMNQLLFSSRGVQLHPAKLCPISSNLINHWVLDNMKGCAKWANEIWKILNWKKVNPIFKVGQGKRASKKGELYWVQCALFKSRRVLELATKFGVIFEALKIFVVLRWLLRVWNLCEHRKTEKTFGGQVHFVRKLLVPHEYLRDLNY